MHVIIETDARVCAAGVMMMMMEIWRNFLVREESIRFKVWNV